MPSSRAAALVKVGVLATCFLVGGFLVIRTGWSPRTVDVQGWQRLQLIAILPMVAGAVVGLRCILDFAWTGHGTPAPIDPPRRPVVVAFYGYVRNPMYVGFGAMLFFAWLAFLPFDWIAL